MILDKDIIKNPHPTLRMISTDVELPVSNETKAKLKEMMEYLKMSQDEELAKKYDITPGVGLASNQINIPKRMLVLYIKDEDKPFEYTIVNPVVIAKSTGMCYLGNGEGCLSVPGRQGRVLRHRRIKVKALVLNKDTDEFEEKVLTFQGYHAIVFQHEYDHINGTLFIDKITNNVSDALEI